MLLVQLAAASAEASVSRCLRVACVVLSDGMLKPIVVGEVGDIVLCLNDVAPGSVDAPLGSAGSDHDDWVEPAARRAGALPGGNG